MKFAEVRSYFLQGLRNDSWKKGQKNGISNGIRQVGRSPTKRASIAARRARSAGQPYGK